MPRTVTLRDFIPLVLDLAPDGPPSSTARGMLTHCRVWEVTKIPARRVDPLRLASLAVRMVLLVPVVVTRALALTLSTAILTTTLTTFSPLLSAVRGRRQSGD